MILSEIPTQVKVRQDCETNEESNYSPSIRVHLIFPFCVILKINTLYLMLTFLSFFLSRKTLLFNGDIILGLALDIGTCFADSGVSISTDLGLASAFVVAHEIGHT